MLYGMWVASQGIRKTGGLPPGSRQIQFCGMGLAVGGIGVAILSIGLLLTDLIGIFLVIQAIAMILYSKQIEKRLG